MGQAHAEQRWQEEFERHLLADEAYLHNPGSSSALADHDHSAEMLLSVRADMIAAEAETRNKCG
ncbi:hypothetical protein [Candidatus Poriferisocius sp.]|uniref:hypothetical protein n=1 Tax=Candidatus Poriferisocius sp. TaxID=3101276 RepID=UPI003B51B710